MPIIAVVILVHSHQDKAKQEKTRQDKTREGKSRQDEIYIDSLHIMTMTTTMKFESYNMHIKLKDVEYIIQRDRKTVSQVH